MERPPRYHPRIRVVQSDPTDALGDHPDVRRELTARRWLYRLGALAVAVAVLGGSALVAAGLVALSRLVGGHR